MVLFCWFFFWGEGWHYSLALLFFLKYIETFSKKKYLIFKTLQFGLNKRSAELSAGVYGKLWEKSHANSVVLFRSEGWEDVARTAAQPGLELICRMEEVVETYRPRSGMIWGVS